MTAPDTPAAPRVPPAREEPLADPADQRPMQEGGGLIGEPPLADLCARVTEALAKLQALEGVDAPLPWTVAGFAPMIYDNRGDAVVSQRGNVPYFEDGVADFIASAPTWLAQLVEGVREMEEQLKWLEVGTNEIIERQIANISQLLAKQDEEKPLRIALGEWYLAEIKNDKAPGTDLELLAVIRDKRIALMNKVGGIIGSRVLGDASVKRYNITERLDPVTGQWVPFAELVPERKHLPEDDDRDLARVDAITRRAKDDTESPLVDLFRGEESDWGGKGDDNGWSPTEAAIELIRSLRAQLVALQARLAEAERENERLHLAITEDAETIKRLTEQRKRAYEIMAEVGSLSEWRKVAGNRTLEISYAIAEVAIAQGGLEVVDYSLVEMRNSIRAALSSSPGDQQEGV